MRRGSNNSVLRSESQSSFFLFRKDAIIQDKHPVNSPSAMKGKQDFGSAGDKEESNLHEIEFPCIFASEKKSDSEI